MIQKSGVPRRIARPGLAMRLIFVLSIAMLPLGLISVYQTQKVIEERRSLSGASLLKETQLAVAASRDIFGAAAEAAETLSALMSVARADRSDCNPHMARLVSKVPEFIFVGYLDENLNMVCSSQPRSEEQFASLKDRGDVLGRPTPGIFLDSFDFLGGVPTVNVTFPASDDGDFRGTMWVAVPNTMLSDALDGAAPDVDLVLFRPNGDVLATEEFTDERRLVLPEGQTLTELAASGQQVFRGNNRAGMTRDFAISAVVPGEVLALGSWAPRHRGLVMSSYAEAMALYFPIAMWAIAMLVAGIGLHRLVIRHVRRLRTWLRLYASGQGDFTHARLDNAPQELEELAETFRAMTGRLREQDRARDEDLEEKAVLLREVHHRVKNNLQLISSMMNMQIRMAKTAEAKYVLRRVQDRVMALAAIHRYLYLARKLSLLRIDKLLHDIIQNLVVVGTLQEMGHRIDVTTELDPIEINPDQSVPVSLLASEAAINAVKYCGNAPGETPWINIALKADKNARGKDTVLLSVVNSRGSEQPVDDDTENQKGSGLGSRLINSFVMQLNGTHEINTLPDRYELHVSFPLAWHGAEEEEESLPAQGVA